MSYYGIVLGAVVILAVGVGHIVVIRWEYHWGARAWPGMLAIGLALIVASVFVGNGLASGALGIFGAVMLWGVHELFKQRERVQRGQFPRNPGREE